MHLVITAGNTLVPIDRVRGITNVFTGRTGAEIALYCHGHGHAVTLLTSHPEVVKDLRRESDLACERWSMHVYRTFAELHDALQTALASRPVDALIHCAAVSDYRAAGVFAPAPQIHFDVGTRTWEAPCGQKPVLVDRSGAKVKSDEPELWLHLVRTPKLIDLVRTKWGFTGLLVKFKLEVDVTDAELLDRAERSRRTSAADLMVANTLEGAPSWAFFGPVDGGYHRVSRSELPARLLGALDNLHRKGRHG